MSFFRILADENISPGLANFLRQSGTIYSNPPQNTAPAKRSHRAKNPEIEFSHQVLEEVPFGSGSAQHFEGIDPHFMENN